MFLLEYNGNTPAFKDSDVLDAVEGIPGKSGNGFRQNKVYFLFSAQLYHLVELFSFLGAYAGYSIVCENSCQLPADVYKRQIYISAENFYSSDNGKKEW